MGTGMKIARVLLIGASLGACTFEQPGIDEALGVEGSAEENLGSISSAAISENYRQPAAVALRGGWLTANGSSLAVKNLYIFACDRGEIKVRIKAHLFGLSPWQAVAPGYDCRAAPSVGVIRSNETGKQDTLGVYWRTTDFHLIEAWYRPNGTMAVTDLTAQEPEVPYVSGTPTVVDTSDPTKIQVVVKVRDTSEVWTIAWTGSRYEKLPVKRADGSTATTVGDWVNVTYNAGYGREYITMGDGPTWDTIVYTRGSASWHKPYTELTTLRPGVMGNVAGLSIAGQPACATGFLIDSGTSQLKAACLDSGTLNWVRFALGVYRHIDVGPNGSQYLFSVRNDEEIWAFNSAPLAPAFNTTWEGTQVVSRIVQPANGDGYAFWIKTVNDGMKTNTLMMADFRGTDPRNATVTDLGGWFFY